MLEIKTIRDKSKYIDKITAMGLAPDTCEVCESYSSGKTDGYGFYHLAGEEVYVDFVEADNLLCFDGIVRSILFKAMLCGIEKAEFSPSILDKLYALKIIKPGESALDSILGLLSHCSGCKS